MRRLAVACSLVLVVLIRPHAQPAGGPLDAAAVQELLSRFQVPGVSISVVKNFKVEWAKGYGLADAENGAPVTADTLFQAASISKTIAAMTSLKAVQDGRFMLDQDVNTILKSWMLPVGEFTKDRPVTPRMLMTAAGLWTTPTDLAKFVIEVQRSLLGTSNRVLKQSTMQEMVTPVGVGPFAVGFTVEKQGEGSYFVHGGSNWGFMCDVIGHRTKGYGLATMTNGDNGAPLIQELRTRIERAYDWDVFDRPIPRTYGPPGNP
jgi:CubicO group peptidase (beta-lactamase class C family)